MKLRRFTQPGLVQFTQYLDQLKAAPTTPPPEWLLTDEIASEAAADVEVVDQQFATRFDAAEYLNGVLCAAKLNNVERDAGLWSWLTLLLFDQVCPPAQGGQRKLGELARYVPAVENFQRYYRHLLLGPYAIYRTPSIERMMMTLNAREGSL
jgi:hypothetical protein